MLRAAFVAFSISALALVFWGPNSQAGWSDAATSLSSGASSVVVSVKKHKNDDDDDDDDKPKKSKDKVIPKTCGKKVNCEAGFVKLEKPNKYGACCEAREGLPSPKTAQPEKCQFPGEVGTPPNCSCPKGTEFLGYKGCVKHSMQRVNCELVPNKPGAYVRQDFWEQKKCFPLYGKDKSWGSCVSYQGSTDPLQCCCEIKVYEK